MESIKLTSFTEGKKVVIKPNWVHHRNGSGHGLDCLVTHISVIEAFFHYVIKARPESSWFAMPPYKGAILKH